MILTRPLVWTFPPNSGFRESGGAANCLPRFFNPRGAVGVAPLLGAEAVSRSLNCRLKLMVFDGFDLDGIFL